jgi:hypothetical protein
LKVENSCVVLDMPIESNTMRPSSADAAILVERLDGCGLARCGCREFRRRFVPTATIEAAVLPLVFSRQFRQRREVFRRTHGLALRSIGAAVGALAFGLVEILLFVRVELFARCSRWKSSRARANRWACPGRRQVAR